MAKADPLAARLTGGRYLPALLVLAVSAAALGGAFLAQYWGGLEPCVLCVYQRYPYGVAIALALAALLSNDPRWRASALALAAAALLADGGIAAYHVGVERQWWEGTAACTGSASAGAATSLEALRAQIMAAPVARCDRIPWQLLGLSIAGYNLLVAVAAALFAAAAARATLRRAAS